MGRDRAATTRHRPRCRTAAPCWCRSRRWRASPGRSPSPPAARPHMHRAAGRPADSRCQRRTVVLRAPDGHAAIRHEPSPVGAVERDDIRGPGSLGMHDHREAELRGQTLGDLRPRLAGVIGAVDATVVLLEQDIGTCRDGSTSLCTHCPVSGCGSGMNPARTPWFWATQVAPPSRVWKVPTAEMATHIRPGRSGAARWNGG